MRRLLLLTLAAALPSLAASAGSAAASAQSPSLTLNVTVSTPNNHPLRNLKLQDFHLTNSNIPQTHPKLLRTLLPKSPPHPTTTPHPTPRHLHRLHPPPPDTPITIPPPRRPQHSHPAPGNLLRRGVIQAADGRRCDQLRGILFGENVLAVAVLIATCSTGKLHCMQTCPLQAWLEGGMSCSDDIGKIIRSWHARHEGWAGYHNSAAVTCNAFSPPANSSTRSGVAFRGEPLKLYKSGAGVAMSPCAE